MTQKETSKIFFFCFRTALLGGSATLQTVFTPSNSTLKAVLERTQNPSGYVYPPFFPRAFVKYFGQSNKQDRFPESPDRRRNSPERRDRLKIQTPGIAPLPWALLGFLREQCSLFVDPPFILSQTTAKTRWVGHVVSLDPRINDVTWSSPMSRRRGDEWLSVWDSLRSPTLFPCRAEGSRKKSCGGRGPFCIRWE